MSSFRSSTPVSTSKTTAEPSFVSSLVSSFTSARPAVQALAVVAAVGSLLGVAALIKRRKVRAAQLKSLLPTQTNYTQFRVEDTTPEGYEELLAATRIARASVAEGHPWYVYIGAATNPATGMPWCGDCVQANPLVHDAFNKAANTKDLVMVAAFVERSSFKEDTLNAHPYRTDPELFLTNVPTLFKFVYGSCVGRLVEAECSDEQALQSFLRKSDRNSTHINQAQ